MSNYINISNQEIVEMIEANPTYEVVKILKKWKAQRNLRDYHTTLELLTAELGISQLMIPYYSNEKCIGWIPYLDYKANNLLKEEKGKYRLIQGSLHSIEKCQRRLTRDALKRLMQVHNIENLLAR